ncbi:YueI family protein [Sporosarcina sp. Marseille-Q4063]|uniref:YueI family protein n=1 Tax=Sporosarcina sp. Marseille-Q4063 TaxID=2810514 RepID=UPI001BAEAFA5|nr:YueI family protein [Sporosarcina sp. Marseille-Q4063]QUW23607.1 YueI family protein [Sporosarcina sp. Marseille-Q4063]
MSNHIDDYLQQGIHGPRGPKPDERRRFLGTYRERIVIALTQAQIREKGIYKQVEVAIKKNRKARLYLNGNMNYGLLTKYTRIAAKYQMNFTMVTNREHDTEIGLVLAYDYAIDKEEIYVKKQIPKAKKEKSNRNGLFANLFKRK